MLFSEYKQLAPTDDILWDYKNNGGKAKYTRRYNEEILGKLNVNGVLLDLNKFIPPTIQMQLKMHKTTFWQSDIVDIILLCHEACEENKNIFCHRFLVSDWFNANGISCREFNTPMQHNYHTYTTVNPYDYQYYNNKK